MLSRIHCSFIALLLGGIGTSTVLLLPGRKEAAASPPVQDSTTSMRGNFVKDATGAPFPIADYRRILSGSSIADAVLPELISTERIVGVSRWYAEVNPNAMRLVGKSRISGLQDLEYIISLQPDLVIVSNYSADASPLERLRERKIQVFDLGPMLGQITLERNLRDLGQLLKQPDTGERMAQALHRRMAQVAAHIPLTRRRRAMYLNLYDTQLHGGTLGSSYYDVLSAAGLIDVAATGRSFAQQGSQAWPRYRVEELLLFAPEVIVTVRGKGKLICEMLGLSSLGACQDPHGILELDDWQLNDPGPGMLSTAEALCDLAYPPSNSY